MKKYLYTDQMREYLHSGTFSEAIKENGLNYLLPAWEKSTHDMTDDRWMIEEFWNDLSRRRTIDELVKFIPEENRDEIQNELKRIDDKYKEVTIEINEFVGSSKLKKKIGEDKIKYWYYYRITEALLIHESEMAKKYSRSVKYTRVS